MEYFVIGIVFPAGAAVACSRSVLGLLLLAGMFVACGRGDWATEMGAVVVCRCAACSEAVCGLW